MNPKEVRQKRLRRHARVRAKIKGSAVRPRLSIFRSHQHLSVQLIDDAAGKTIAAVSDRDITEKNRGGSPAGGRMAVAALLGVMIAEKARANKITEVVFDRGGYRYHGIMRVIADAVRQDGIAL